MSTTIASVALTFGQFALLAAARDGWRIVGGADLRAARALEEKGLGTVGQRDGKPCFEINEAGRDQLRIRQ